MSRNLYEIARLVKLDWPRAKRGAAAPYLDAMHELTSINDNYYLDTGRSIVSYFLANAGTWRGETARAIKVELNAMLAAERS